MVNILIADDNIYYAKMLMNVINTDIDTNIKVTHLAVDGKETLDILENNQIDVTLLDLKMPIYDGMYILDKLKQEQKDKYEQSIIVISGETEMLYKINSQPYVYCALNKVCSISKIIDTIKELVEDKEQEKQTNNVKNNIIKQLQYLNYNLSHKGTQYLIDAILLIYNRGDYDIFNLKEDVYPIIAKRYNKSIHNIKCDINKANDYMYRVCKKERIRKYFKFFDDSKPTVKNVIYTILNKVIKNSNAEEKKCEKILYNNFNHNYITNNF